MRGVRRIVAALACGATLAFAEPYESDPGLAKRDDDYAAGLAHVEKKDFTAAVKAFEKACVRHPDHADLLNMLAFSYRKLGQFEPAFRHYKDALKIDPRHRGAHEYIGEAYLQVGDLANARKHLEALKQICLLPCDELGDLQKAIDAHVAKAPKPAT